MKLPTHTAAVLLSACLLAAPCHGALPVWWQSNGQPADDFAKANQGQLKHFTKRLIDHLNAIPGAGAGPELTALLGTWTSPSPQVDDYAIVNIGQMKEVARLVYNRLAATGRLYVPPSATHYYPWTAATQDDVDFAEANIGQLKALFNFDLSNNGDRDGDGIPDVAELVHTKTNPDSADTDNDGTPDGLEDSDGDGLRDGFEVLYGFNPLVTGEQNGNPDNDGLTNLAEQTAGTNPLVSDTDGDGLGDGFEVTYGFNPLVGGQQLLDPDLDGSSNLTEFQNGTNPLDYYNGDLPDLRIVSGNDQFTPAAAVAPLPLVIEVRDTPVLNSPLLPDAPVEFSIISGGGLMGLSQSGPFSAGPFNLRSDLTLGRAQVWYQQPNTNGTTSTVRVKAVSGAASTTKDFSIYTHYLAGYWKLDEASGTAAADSSPVTPLANATILNTPVRVDGLGVTGTWLASDLAFNLNGTSQSLTIANASKLQFTQSGTAFSIGAWVRVPTDLDLTATTNNYPVAAKWSASGTGFEFGIQGGTSNGPVFLLKNNGANTQMLKSSTDLRATLKDGYPHYIVFTRDVSGTGRLYLDGSEVGSLAGMNTSLSNTADLLLGKNNATPSNQFFKGALDDVKVLSSTYNSTEITAQYTIYDSDADGLPDSWEKRYFAGSLANSKTSDNDTGSADGLSNEQEYLRGTRPDLRDTDTDGLNDGFEVTYSFNPLVAGEQTGNPDNDGLTNLQEQTAGTNPLIADTDGDGLKDGFEVTNGFNPLVVGEQTGDPDNDGLTNLAEQTAGTNPLVADHDGDGLKDGFEVTYGFNPLVAGEQTGNPDNDGINNLAEQTAGTNPLVADTDGDGLKDGFEVAYGFNPLVAGQQTGNPDNDGLTNLQEQTAGTNPLVADTDGDGMSDGFEVANGFNPLQGGQQTSDPDNDGLSNLREYQLGTNPNVADTDGDTISDALEDNDGDGLGNLFEFTHGFNPLAAGEQTSDTDTDGLTNLQEYQADTNPLVDDTDSDGLKDGYEVQLGYNPIIVPQTTTNQTIVGVSLLTPLRSAAQ